MWETSLNNLSKLLDTLCKYDNIELTVEDERNLGDFVFEPITEDETSKLGFKPYQHQVEGINFGLKHHKFLLLDNPGCGKTNQTIGLAETLKRREKIEHCLVIVGINSLKSNWQKEIRKFGTENSIIIGQKFKRDGTASKVPMSIAERISQLNKEISEFFVIINVESLRDDGIIKALKSGPNKFGMIVIDEVHKCLATGRSSVQGANILKLDADYKVALSGTILLNTPINCWGPLYWIGADKATLTNFKSQYCNFGGFSGYEIVGYQNLDLLKEELENCSLRRSKEKLVDLPPKTVTVELLDMEPAHQKFYDAVKEGVKDEAMKVELHAGNLLALTTRLRQASVDPGILTTENVVSTKIERCVELAEEIVSSGNKVVIMSTFKPPVYKLYDRLAEFKPLLCTGDQSDDEVSENIDKFQADDEHMILICTLAKGSTGLTMNRASYMIMLDEHWTSAMNNQCQDRIYRLNNTTPAFITVLACKDTIDERVHDVAQYKQELSDFVVDNKPSEKFTDIMRSIIQEL